MWEADLLKFVSVWGAIGKMPRMAKTLWLRGTGVEKENEPYFSLPRQYCYTKANYCYYRYG